MESAVLDGNAITYYQHILNTKDGMHDGIVVYEKESYQEAQKMPPLTLLEKITKGIKNSIFSLYNFLENLSHH
jgi:hypothetical protein